MKSKEKLKKYALQIAGIEHELQKTNQDNFLKSKMKEIETIMEDLSQRELFELIILLDQLMMN